MEQLTANVEWQQMKKRGYDLKEMLLDCHVKIRFIKRINLSK